MHVESFLVCIIGKIAQDSTRCRDGMNVLWCCSGGL